MCSRYSLTSPPEAVRAVFGPANALDFPPRYNIAPTQPIVIVRRSEQGGREMALVRWGLIPSWAKDPAKLSTLINARSETAADKPSFRGAMRHRRCLVPCDGFYEWTGPAGAKQPHLIRPRVAEALGEGSAVDAGEVAPSRLMAMAGIWEDWMGADGSEIATAAILTVPANGLMSRVHDRMPAILQSADFAAWLDTRAVLAPAAAGLLAPAPEALLEIVDVSRKLNNPRNEGPQLHQPDLNSLL